MQPTNPQRPVMDISTPRRPAPVPAKPPVQVAAAPLKLQPADDTTGLSPAPQPEKSEPAPEPVTGNTSSAGNATSAPDFSKAPSLPVHEAPQSVDAEPLAEHEQRPTPAGNQDDRSADAPSQPDTTTDSAPVPIGPPEPTREKTPLPVGAIVAAVFAMIALSAAAILVYLKA